MNAAQAKCVLISGGTGFLGRFLVDEFLNNDYRVAVLCRATSDRSALAGRDVTLFEADIEDRAAVQVALQDAKKRLGEFSFVHNAALISYRKRDGRRLQAANVDGVRNVFEACQAHGVRRVVHVSSVVAVGASRNGDPVLEQDPFALQNLNVDYVNTKYAGECIALEDWGPMSVTVVNPGAIFGPVQVDSNSARFLIGMAQGRIGRLAPPGGMAAVGVWDCAQGTRLAMERGESGQRYVLTESYLPSRKLFACVGQIMHGRDPVWGTLPRWMWGLLSTVIRLVSLVREPVMTTPQAMRMLSVHFNCSGQRAKDELGWLPTPFPEVMQKTIETMVADGVLPYLEGRGTKRT